MLTRFRGARRSCALEAVHFEFEWYDAAAEAVVCARAPIANDLSAVSARIMLLM